MPIYSVFYPETARKTLEELDFIFDKTDQGMGAVMSMTKDVEGATDTVAKDLHVSHVEDLASKMSKV
jgi:hypothetical protein